MKLSLHVVVTLAFAMLTAGKKTKPPADGTQCCDGFDEDECFMLVGFCGKPIRHVSGIGAGLCCGVCGDGCIQWEGNGPRPTQGQYAGLEGKILIAGSFPDAGAQKVDPVTCEVLAEVTPPGLRSNTITRGEFPGRMSINGRFLLLIRTTDPEPIAPGVQGPFLGYYDGKIDFDISPSYEWTIVATAGGAASENLCEPIS